LAGADSKPEGPGVSSSFLRNCRASSLIISIGFSGSANIAPLFACL
jgi:hypothetical protein